MDIDRTNESEKDNQAEEEVFVKDCEGSGAPIPLARAEQEAQKKFADKDNH